MSERISLRFEMMDGADAEKAKEDIQAELAAMEGVEQAAAMVRTQRLTGLEVVAAVSAVAVIATSVRKAVQEGRGAVQEGTKLMQDLEAFAAQLRRLILKVGGVKDAVLEVGARKVPLAQVTGEDLREALA